MVYQIPVVLFLNKAIYIFVLRIFMEQSIPRLKIHLLKSTNKVLCCLKTHKKKAARRQAKKKNSCKKEVLDSEYLLQVSGILDSLLKWICDNVY